MARRSGPMPGKPAAQLSQDQIRQAIILLDRRIGEIKAINVGQIGARSDPTIKGLNTKIEDTLARIFGDQTQEFSRFMVAVHCTAPISILEETPIHEIRSGFLDGVHNAVVRLEAAKEMLAEKLEDLNGTPATRASRTFSDLDVHPAVFDAAGDLFRNGHYANAVEDACKALDPSSTVRFTK